MAVQDKKPLALTQSINCFRAGSSNYINNRSPHAQFLNTHRSVRLHEEPSIIFSKRRARTEARQGRSDFLCARPRTRDIFAAELRLTRQKKIFFTTRSRSSYERAGWSGDFRFVFAFRFSFFVFVYQAKKIQYCFYHKPLKNSTVLHLPLSRRINTAGALKEVKTVPHIPLYMTSTYNSKTAVQYHMTNLQQ